MKNWILVIFLAFMPGNAVAGEVPFFAGPSVPDYMASMMARDTYGKTLEYKRTVWHHDGWTRVEEAKDNEVRFSYGHFFKSLVLRGGRDQAGQLTWFGIQQVDPFRDDLSIKATIDTHEEEMIAGERCRWTDLVRQAAEAKRSGPQWFSCLTDDGIEIAEKVLFNDKKLMSDARLLTLKRGPVDKTDALPPRQLFDAGFWLKPMRTYSSAPPDAVDFEARLVGESSEVRLLRHYPWCLREIRGKDGSIRLLIWNSLEDQGISYTSKRGERRLEAARRTKGQHWSQFDMTTGKVDLGRRETLLGEECTWFDLMPNVADAGNQRCLTSDGIPMMDVYTSGWGAGERFRTVGFKRRNVSISELRLPDALLDPANWGFLVVETDR